MEQIGVEIELMPMKYEESHHDADRKINNFVTDDNSLEPDILPAKTEIIYTKDREQLPEETAVAPTKFHQQE